MIRQHAAGSAALTGPSFRRVLVTGAEGFVGRYVVAALAGSALAPAQLFLATRQGGSPAGGVPVVMDLEDPDQVNGVVARLRPDLVIHLAAQASVGRSSGDAANTWSVNFGGSFALGRALANHAPECTLLFASSAEVYGLAFNGGIVDERTAPAPQSPYARSKLAAEGMLADVLPETARLIVVRPGNHSGPGQREDFVIPAFAAQVVRAEMDGTSPICVGNLDAERDFLDVRDVVQAYVALLVQSGSLASRTIFNVASGKVVRIGDILDRLRALARTPTHVRSDPGRLRRSEVPCARVDASALHVAIGWQPTHSLDDMIADVLRAQRERQLKDAANPI